MKYLILGHPRTGTGYAAKCAQRAGYDVGHERIRNDGISSWMWVPGLDVGDVPWGDAPSTDDTPDCVLYTLRDPYEAVVSVALTEGSSEEWRQRHIHIPDTYNPFERAVVSLSEWYCLAQKNWANMHCIRLDDMHKFFGVDAGSVYNARKHLDVSKEWLQRLLNEECLYRLGQLTQTYNEAAN